MPKKFSEFKREMREIYDGIGVVWCPAIKEDVHFNAKGFHHLRFEVTGDERKISEQVYKLGLIPFVEQVVRDAAFVSESRRTKAPVNRKRSRGNGQIKHVTYIALVGRNDSLGKYRIRVVLRKIGMNGETIFWSVMGGGKPKKRD